jgi:ribose 5-phosphate isomerase A
MKTKADLDREKQSAAKAAVTLVRPGMRLGLGTGSTSEWFAKYLAEAVRDGKLDDIVAVPTSEKVAALASSLGLRLIPLEEDTTLDLCVDGADEIGPGLELIKGGGGALLREKVVASASRRSLIIADSSKSVEQLGAFPLPLEVAPFAVGFIKSQIVELGGRSKLRTTASGATAVTDQGLWLLDCHFGPEDSPRIADARILQHMLESIPGIAAHGLFLDTTAAALLADGDEIHVQTRQGPLAFKDLNLDTLPPPRFSRSA